MQNSGEDSFILGVLGGMGPLASAEFLKTIYESSIHGREQSAPTVILYSDPSTPDRTTTYLEGREGTVLQPMIQALNRLIELGATKIVICCVTSHLLMSRFPRHIREKVISLPDVIFDALQQSEERRLLLCTVGSRKSGVFERHPRWSEMNGRVILPSDSDQSIIHDEIIYEIKRNRPARELIPLVKALLRSYGVNSFIAGCTELHLLAKQEWPADDYERSRCIDPLSLIATNISRHGSWRGDLEVERATSLESDRSPLNKDSLPAGDEKRAALTGRIIVDLFQAIDASDWEAILNIFHPEIVYERPGYAPFSGSERLLYFYQHERVLASGAHNLERIMYDGNSAACWGRFVGKKKDGSDVDEMFADVYTFEDGKIRTRRSFFFRPAV